MTANSMKVVSTYSENFFEKWPTLFQRRIFSLNFELGSFLIQANTCSVLRTLFWEEQDFQSSV